jgi:quinol monooxygenase YgiN
MTPDDKADSIILFELYASKQAMETHMEGSSLAQFRAETEGQILTINVETCSHHR